MAADQHAGSDGNRDALTSTYGENIVEPLEALVTYCDEAAALVERGRQAYEEDVLLQRAAEAIFNRIGDTIRSRLPGAFLEAFPAQPWRTIVGMRVRMAHIYAENDHSIIWKTLVRDVPRLRSYLSVDILGDH